MERRGQLDAAGRPAVGELSFSARAVLAVVAVAAPLAAQSDLRALYEAERYESVIEDAADAVDADPLYLRGMSLARLGRWEEARDALRTGERRFPSDVRFPTELGGVAYRLERLREARRQLRRAVRLAPADDYARDFLATLYLLDDNVDAALVHWNAIGRPRLGAVQLPDPLATDDVLLDRALAFAPGQLLQVGELRRSRALLELLDVFATYEFDLAPESDADDYLLRLRGFERRGWGRSPLLWAARALRGLPYETAFFDMENWRGEATHFRSMARWDDRKRRAAFELTSPLAGEARWRWKIFGDARDERWALAEPQIDAASGEFRMRTAEIGAGFDAVANGRFDWGGEAAFSVRDFAEETQLYPRMPDAPGARATVRGRWLALDLPGRRFSLKAEGRFGVERVFDSEVGLFTRVEGAVEARREDFRGWDTTARLSLGRVGDKAPFDGLYSLGMERDNPLWVRALRGTRDGRKGAAPLGDRYWLARFQITRRALRYGFLDLRAGPFFDAGRIADSGGLFGSPRTELAAGAQIELRVFGSLGVTLLYGRDLRRGQGVVYTHTLPFVGPRL